MADKTYKYILDFKGKTDQIQKDVGGVKGLLKGAALAAGALFAVDKVMDAARAVADYAKEIDGIRTQVEKLTGAQGSGLNAITGQVKALAQTYNVDVKDAISGTNTMMVAFGANSKEAFDAINAGLSTAANANGDFLEQVREYSMHFKEAGLSASEMVAVIAEGSKMGVFNDKSADAIKEGTIRLREMAQGTRDAINAIGLSSTKIQQEISSGNMSMFEVMQLVSRQLKSLPEQSPAVGQALADIFGGPGEDAVQFIRSLDGINTNLAEVIKNSGGAAAAQIRLTEETAKFHEIGAQVFGGTTALITNMKASLFEFATRGIQWVVEFANKFIDLYNESEDFRVSVQRLKTTWEILTIGVRAYFDVMFTNMKAVGMAIVKFISGNFGEIPGIIGNALDQTTSIYTNAAKDAYKAFNEGWDKNVKESRLSVIKLDLGAVVQAGEKAGEEFAKGFKVGSTGSGPSTFGASGKGADLIPMSPLSGGVLPNTYGVQLVEQNNQIIESNKAVIESFYGLGGVASDTLNSIAQRSDENTAKWLEWSGVILTQIPAIISALIAMGIVQRTTSAANMVASQGEAMASTAAGAAKLPFPANLIAIGAGVAAIAAIWASFPRAEFGGIVPGNSFSGDKQMIRVNSGEEVLRRDDPRHALNQRGTQSGGGSIINILQDGIVLEGNKLRILLKKEERRVSLRAIPVG
jgi:hypothetical protein